MASLADTLVSTFLGDNNSFPVHSLSQFSLWVLECFVYLYNSQSRKNKYCTLWVVVVVVGEGEERHDTQELKEKC